MVTNNEVIIGDSYRMPPADVWVAATHLSVGPHQATIAPIA